MTDPLETDPRAEAAVFQAASLLSVLTSAAEVWHRAEERRAGRDPSAQEDAAVVWPYLRGAQREMQEMLMRLQASHAHAERADEDAVTALVRRFDSLLTLGRLARLVQTAHQRLLSLYPDVGEGLIEEARHVQAGAAALLDADPDRFADDLPPFLDRALRFNRQLERVLRPL